jgi:hypothetical protein
MTSTLAATSAVHGLPPGPRSPAWWQRVRFAGDPLGMLDEWVVTLRRSGKRRTSNCRVGAGGRHISQFAACKLPYHCTAGSCSILLARSSPNSSMLRVGWRDIHCISWPLIQSTSKTAATATEKPVNRAETADSPRR